MEAKEEENKFKKILITLDTEKEAKIMKAVGDYNSDITRIIKESSYVKDISTYDIEQLLKGFFYKSPFSKFN